MNGASGWIGTDGAMDEEEKMEQLMEEHMEQMEQLVEQQME